MRERTTMEMYSELMFRFGKCMGNCNFLAKWMYTVPEELFKKYATAVTRIIHSGHQGGYEQALGYNLLHSAGRLMLVAPEFFDQYVDIGMGIAKKDLEAADSYFTKMSEALIGTVPERKTALLPAARKLAEKDIYIVTDFLQRQPTQASHKRGRKKRVTEPSKTYTEDELLLDFIHDPHSANLVKPLVDMKNPDIQKAYAKRVRRFY